MDPNTAVQAGASGSGTQGNPTTSLDSGSDWIGGLLRLAKGMEAAGEFAPFPYIKGACGVVVSVIEVVQEVKRNREDLQELCEGIGRILNILQNEMGNHSGGVDKFKDLCEGFERCLREILKSVKILAKKPQGFRGHAKEIFHLDSTKAQIAGHQRKIEEFRKDFLLRISMRIGFHLLGTNNPNKAQIPSKINECPAPSRVFQGRQRILQEMKTFFEDGSMKQHICLLHGLGGIGKTQIALKFIDDLASKFSDIFLLDMSSQTTIKAGLKNIAIIKQTGSTQEDAMKWLGDVQSNWFLLFDNADDPNINLNPYLPRCNQGNILITSRNPGLSVHAGAHWLVSDMEESDAAVLLLKGAAKDVTDPNMETAREISQALYCLPLAITQASAFIAKSGKFKGYLELYKRNRDRLLGEKPTQQQDGYTQSVYTTWEMSFHRLSPTAQTLLQLCSCLHYQGISEMIFQNAAKYNTNAKPDGPSKKELRDAYEFIANFQNQAGEWDSLAFIEVATELQAYALISFDEETAFFSIHPLVHGWCQNLAVDQVEVMINLMGMSISEGHYSDAQSVGMLPHLETLIQDRVGRSPLWNEQFAQTYFQSFKFKLATEFRSQVWREKQDRHGENHPQTLKSMEQLGISYRGLGQFSDALPLEMLVLQKRKKLLGEEHPDTLSAMGNLAMTHKELGEFNDALPLQTLVLEKQNKLLGEEHPDTLTAMTQLANTYMALGEFNDALPLQTFVLEKRKKLLGEEHPDTLSAMGNLAITHKELGEFNDALLLEVLVSEKRKKRLGEEHPDTLLAMGNLAITHKELGEFNDALLLEVLVLEKRKKLLGEEHPDTLWAMGNLASTHGMLGRFNDALLLEVLVSEKRKKRLGEEHPDTLSAMGNLANTYMALGEFNDALPLQTLVLEKRKKLLGEEHPDTLSAMGNLAVTHKELGEFNDALLLEVLVLEKRRKLLGEEHPATLSLMGNLAVTHKELGEFNDALLLEVLVLEKRKKLLGEEHPDTLSAMGNLAITHKELGEFNDALLLEVLVSEKRKKRLGEEHPDTLWAMGNLAITHKELGEFNDALLLEVLVLEKRKKLLGEEHPHTLSAMGNLANTHGTLGEFNDALPLQTLVLEKRKKLLGEEHPDTLWAMGNLANTHGTLGEFNDALLLETFVLGKRKKLLGEEHPHTLSAMGNLAITHKQLGEFNDALLLETFVLAKRQKCLGQKHPATLRTMRNLIKTYQGLGKAQEVEVLNNCLEQAQAT
ncbi:hypothetical protein FB45DRAFT_483618 [Roridomyces roridus]|uniref:DUF7779 domain-containing protein n=1 Tax=Roridomyces roridus TaxID=1738132 RepID=A0AAD7FRR0_9AGAR|nr:hypothetical protein FB45DRAFT_483618 [Roridomyces roridus]